LHVFGQGRQALPAAPHPLERFPGWPRQNRHLRTLAVLLWPPQLEAPGTANRHHQRTAACAGFGADARAGPAPWFDITSRHDVVWRV
jgi:hypothetical protein